MNLLAFGINHKTAPRNSRAAIVYTENHPASIATIICTDAVNEALILSTCNRTELYCDTRNTEYATRWLADYHQLPQQNKLPEQVLISLAHQLTQKIMHMPSIFNI